MLPGTGAPGPTAGPEQQPSGAWGDWRQGRGQGFGSRSPEMNGKWTKEGPAVGRQGLVAWHALGRARALGLVPA